MEGEQVDVKVESSEEAVARLLGETGEKGVELLKAFCDHIGEPPANDWQGRNFAMFVDRYKAIHQQVKEH